MITLPKEIKTTMLKSFWIVFCIWSTGIVLLILMLILEFERPILLLLSIPVLIIPGFLIPEKIVGLYKVFNRMTRKIIRKVRDLTLKIMYYIFYFSLKSNDSRKNHIDFSNDETAWSKKVISEVSGNAAIKDFSKASSDTHLEFMPMLRWIFKSKNWSMLWVVPFILILSFLTFEDEKSRIAENTYTLY